MFLFPWIEIFKSTEGAGPQSPSCCTLIFLQWPRTDIFGHGPKKEAGVGQKREEKILQEDARASLASVFK